MDQTHPLIYFAEVVPLKQNDSRWIQGVVVKVFEPKEDYITISLKLRSEACKGIIQVMIRGKLKEEEIQQIKSLLNKTVAFFICVNEVEGPDKYYNVIKYQQQGGAMSRDFNERAQKKFLPQQEVISKVENLAKGQNSHTLLVHLENGDDFVLHDNNFDLFVIPLFNSMWCHENITLVYEMSDQNKKRIKSIKYRAI